MLFVCTLRVYQSVRQLAKLSAPLLSEEGERAFMTVGPLALNAQRLT